MTTFPRPIHAVVLLSLAALSLNAQTQSQQAVGFLNVGSEKERVLRVLQIIGDVPLYPWSLRQLSPGEEDRLRLKTAADAALMPAEATVSAFGPLKLKPLPVETEVIYNSAFPYGFNDGPIWAGKGLTTAVSGGVAGRIGPLSFQLEPLAFAAQNLAFPLAPGIDESNPVSAYYSAYIDLPERFGETAYRRFDLGQSSLRLDLGFVYTEVSTANQWWGPAIESPLILGDNAAGFPHVSIGTARPLYIGIGSVYGSVVWGRLEQSAYSPTKGPDSLRFMSGAVAVFMPRGFEGLEIGVTRFFHSQWPVNGLRHAPFGRPFEGILKTSLESADNPTGSDSDNQLASVFARWVFPRSGFEAYGEYGREDHNVDARDFWQEPDHDAGYTVGLQRAWRRTGDVVFAVRGELSDTRLSPLNQGRPQSPWYIHSALTQGHTELGQLLGAPGGFGGGASTFAFDWYSPSVSWTLAWDRIVRADYQFKSSSPDSGSDTFHSLGVQGEIRRNKIAYTFGGHAIWDLNRDFTRDQFNLNSSLGVRILW